MHGRLAALWQYLADYLRTALWVVPAAMTLGAIVLAYAALSFGPAVDAAVQREVWWLHSGTGRDAARLMGTLLSSTITVTTLVVSIMVVVLTLAANQLGPRLIRSFISDRRTQVALGVFIAAIAYMLVVLRTLDSAMATAKVPHTAVTLGSFLALASIGVLLFFVHHLTRSIVADTVIARVGAEVERALRDRPRLCDGDSEPAPPAGGASVDLRGGGYVQVVDYDGMVRCAEAASATVVLDIRPGDHLLPGQPALRVVPAAALTKDLAQGLRATVILGPQRTAPQDPQLGLRQLVEIGLRALSAGINDPYTAIAVIDRLALALARDLALPPPKAVHRDGGGTARVFARPAIFAELVDTAYGQLRQDAEGRADILLRLLSALGELARAARRDDQRAVLGRHAGMVLTLARRSIHEPRDLAVLERRWRDIAPDAS
ncbi:MAG: DUF2254 domain-containing protein [Pseudomonadota bacterium]